MNRNQQENPAHGKQPKPPETDATRERQRERQRESVNRWHAGEQRSDREQRELDNPPARKRQDNARTTDPEPKRRG